MKQINKSNSLYDSIKFLIEESKAYIARKVIRVCWLFINSNKFNSFQDFCCNQVQAKMAKAQKNRASKLAYISPNQLTLVGFDSPFSNRLSPSNRWVVLSQKIPWDTLVNVYQKQMNNSETGADGINPRVVIGSLIIKHICDLSDRETVQQIQENMYMQYFIGYNSFSDQPPFDPSLFVGFRKRLGIEQINEINEKILNMYNQKNDPVAVVNEVPPAQPAVVTEEPLPIIITAQPVPPILKFL